MVHTLCFSGMDRAEEAKLKLLLADANEWLGGEWSLAPENDADVLIIDLESMYGHMTWLKVHNSGRHIIALTSRDQTEAEHVLLRPVTVESLVAALSAATGQAVPQRATVSAGDAMASARKAGAGSPAVETARPGKPQAVPHKDVQMPLQERPAVREAPASQSPLQQKMPEKAVERPTSPPPPPPAKPREPVLWDYLRPGKLFGPSRLELEGVPPLIIDPQSDTYIGDATLKPFIPYCELRTVRLDQWQPVNAATLKQLGSPQPLARLRWLYALVQGRGTLAPGYDPADKFRLTRWPKTEREFPRHFRIATVMMHAPATLAEIAVQSNTSLDETTDFVNASLDSGFAEPYVPPPTTPDAAAKSGGLLGRLRGR